MTYFLQKKKKQKKLSVELFSISVLIIFRAFKLSEYTIKPSSLLPLTGLPRSGKNVWKMKFFPGQGKVREFCGWSGKFRKDLESPGKVREFEK